MKFWTGASGSELPDVEAITGTSQITTEINDLSIITDTIDGESVI